MVINLNISFSLRSQDGLLEKIIIGHLNIERVINRLLKSLLPKKEYPFKVGSKSSCLVGSFNIAIYCFSFIFKPPIDII